LVSPRFSAYSDASKAVFAIFNDTTPLVEGISVDEAFLDVGGLRRLSGTPFEIATRLRARVLDEVGLPITVGIARTKFLAKVASRVAKPDGLLVVPPDRELEFLHPLVVERLWGVGIKTATKLHDRGIDTVADVARLEVSTLMSILGPHAGRHLHALAHNYDPRPVEVGRRRRSIGSQRAIGWRAKAPGEIEATLAGLVDRVTRRLRAANRVGRTVVIRMRFEDWSRATRSHTMARPTARTEPILETARGLLADVQPLIDDQGLTLIGVAVMNLDDDDAVQLPLPFDRRTASRLDAALDEVRDRFGSAAVSRAGQLGHDPGFAVPLLPD
jgi:DNA polymerase-4